jgi:hypothetical protein
MGASMMEFLEIEKEVKNPEADSLSYGSWLSWLQVRAAEADY